MSAELKPCPNCDSMNIALSSANDWWVTCHSCLMEGPIKARIKEAIAKWNSLPRRADIKRLRAERDRCAAVCEWLHNADLEIISNSPAELPEVDRMISELEACAKLKGEKADVCV